MTRFNKLYLAMVTFDAGDARRIQHFVKVHSFAALIGHGEALDAATQEILEAAALVHDIGIHPAEEKYGRCDGKLQEELGPAPARALALDCGYTEAEADRIAYLVGHHHTYTGIDGLDYQILVEADFLVNLYEDAVPLSAIEHALTHIFRTPTGTALCRTMFGLPDPA